MNIYTSEVEYLRDKVKQLEEALAKQEQGEPVAWMDKENHDVIVSAKDWDNIDPLWYWMYQPLYTTPQPAQNPWVGLTAEEREQVQTESYGKVPHHVALIAAVEAKLKEKNNG